jgi:hypothetical protein
MANAILSLTLKKRREYFVQIRVLSSVFLILLAVVALPLAIYGAMMSAFEPTGNYNPNQPNIAIVAIAAFALIPAITIWIPHRAALILGGIVLLPPTAIALFLLWAAPAGGLIGCLPIGLWYFGAVYIWKRL